jgi:hypothetical protein
VGQPLEFSFSKELDTLLVVPLPQPLQQGQSVTVRLDFTLRLPEKQGRWGHWKGVTFLANWYPIVAYYDDEGWRPTPFVAWHQPFFNEAGHYHARVALPAGEKIASTGTIRQVEPSVPGMQVVHIQGGIARDFSLVCSRRFQEFCGQAGGTRVRVLAFPEHAHYAQKALQFACEAIPIYNRWFGPYPYDEFDIAESYFPWNGNESSGLIMIDERVFSMPKMAEPYLDHLVSHETMHQWWYNVVGTNGYGETWMDEGIVSYYTARRFKEKYGPNAPLIRYPGGFQWLPNLNHEDYRFSGMYGTLARREETRTIQPLPEFGHLVTLFSMTYDRGAKILGMIEDRVGHVAFADFMRILYAKYQFRILRVVDFQRELEAYTGRCWKEFFDRWLFGVGATDWAIDDVEMTALDGSKHGAYRTSVIVRQKAEFTEPTVLGVCFEEGGPCAVRLPICPGAAIESDQPPARMETLPDGRVRVEMILPSRPAQISIDPDQILLDREPANNHWKPQVHWRFTPLYTPLEETDLTTPYDRWSVITGPWFDQRGHVGLRTGLYRLQHFRGGVYVAYDVDDEDLQLGADGLWDHWPFNRTQVGFNFDHSLTPDWEGTRRDRGRLFARYIFQYTPSLYMDPMEFVEVYGRVENELWHDHIVEKPGIERYDDLAALGILYHRDYLTPYWDPVAGYRVDLNYEMGFPVLGGDESYQRLQGEVSFVQALPEGLGYLSDTRLAFRAYGGIGVPDNGEHFQLGGPRRVRGLERAARQGNALWIGSAEWRFPLWRDADIDACDHVMRLRHLYGAAFYDVGEIYLDGDSVEGVAHSVGVGLRLDVAWFSFVERTTFRLDVAKVVNSDDNVEFWFGMQYPF